MTADTGADGRVMGTPDYMSPEQCRGLPLGHGADIYSMGVVLFEMLLGRMPFVADSPLETLEIHVTAAASWPHALAKSLGVPPEAEAVVMRALAKAPEDRQPSMLDLQHELGALTRHLRPAGVSGASPRPRISNVGAPSSAKPSITPNRPHGGVRETRAEPERPRGAVVALERSAERETPRAATPAPIARGDADAPVVVLEIWEGMLVLALGGGLDAGRVATIAERARGEIERRRADSVLIDGSGLSSVDRGTLEHLRALASAITRPGVHCVLTGVRPPDEPRAEPSTLPTFKTLVDGIAVCMRDRESRR